MTSEAFLKRHSTKRKCFRKHVAPTLAIIIFVLDRTMLARQNKDKWIVPANDQMGEQVKGLEEGC